MQGVIIYYYVNEFGTYLLIEQVVLTGVLQRREENSATLPHSAQRKNEFLVKKKEKAN